MARKTLAVILSLIMAFTAVIPALAYDNAASYAPLY